jgi:polyphosphate kinase
LKTHAKVALVVRRVGRASRLCAYRHGQHHVRTARLYTDIGLLTCDPATTAGVVKLFHHLTGRSDAPVLDRLLVAPSAMRERFVALIAREVDNRRAGRPARIVAKMNQVEDLEMIRALCKASRAGVPIDLIVRGLCCLRPGMTGFSESVRIRSVIGRFLEHSRIFHFAAGHEDPRDGVRLRTPEAEVVHQLAGRRLNRVQSIEVLAWSTSMSGTWRESLERLRASSQPRSKSRGWYSAQAEVTTSRFW